MRSRISLNPAPMPTAFSPAIAIAGATEITFTSLCASKSTSPLALTKARSSMYACVSLRTRSYMIAPSTPILSEMLPAKTTVVRSTSVVAVRSMLRPAETSAKSSICALAKF